MVRTLIMGLVGLTCCCTLAAQDRQEERKERREERRERRREALRGVFQAFRDGQLLVRVDGKNVEVKIDPDFKTTVWGEKGDPREGVPARESLRNLRAGTPIHVEWADGDRIGSVTIGTPRERVGKSQPPGSIE